MSRFRNSVLAANIKATVIAWVVAAVCTLLLAALILVLSALTSESDTLAKVWVFVAFVASMAVLFLAGFVCSRFAADRSAVWILIVVLLLPGLIQRRWGNPWVSILGNGGLPMDGFDAVAGLIGIAFGAIFMWLVGVLPVLAGANFEERRRFSGRQG